MHVETICSVDLASGARGAHPMLSSGASGSSRIQVFANSPQPQHSCWLGHISTGHFGRCFLEWAVPNNPHKRHVMVIRYELPALCFPLQFGTTANVNSRLSRPEYTTTKRVWRLPFVCAVCCLASYCVFIEPPVNWSHTQPLLVYWNIGVCCELR